MPSAYWIAYSDIHGDCSPLGRIPDLREAAGSIICGDLTLAGGKEAAARVLDACGAYSPVMAALPGNMDMPEVLELLHERGISLHGRAVRPCPEVALIGVGGSNPTPFRTPYELSEDEIAAALEKALDEAGSYAHLVLVSHAPPLGGQCDRLRGGGHAGSAAVRSFIEKVQPELCLCGHIHEARGLDRLGNCTVINPGPLSEGGYIKISFRETKPHAELLRLI